MLLLLIQFINILFIDFTYYIIKYYYQFEHTPNTRCKNATYCIKAVAAATFLNATLIAVLGPLIKFNESCKFCRSCNHCHEAERKYFIIFHYVVNHHSKYMFFLKPNEIEKSPISHRL